MCDFIGLVEKACQEGAFKPLMTVEEDAAKIERTIINKAKKAAYAAGVEEGQASIIQSLLESGMSIEEVSRIIKMPVEEIEQKLNINSHDNSTL